MAEAIANRIGEHSEGRLLLRILSNKADLRLCRARAVFDAESLGGEGLSTTSCMQPHRLIPIPIEQWRTTKESSTASRQLSSPLETTPEP
ncbi:hypothetical protein [Streptomyces sp. SID13031]|uniref:hypothetical protein n=1 Tax=Streptomyces sp. SID13031 TaxID=2706046 RepID=UPI0019442EC2|nr:hypothetical protein [Streptomyces sp. SID13031]